MLLISSALLFGRVLDGEGRNGILTRPRLTGGRGNCTAFLLVAIRAEAVEVAVEVAVTAAVVVSIGLRDDALSKRDADVCDGDERRNGEAPPVATAAGVVGVLDPGVPCAGVDGTGVVVVDALSGEPLLRARDGDGEVDDERDVGPLFDRVGLEVLPLFM